VVSVKRGRRRRAGGFEDQRYREGLRNYRRRITPLLLGVVVPCAVVGVLLSCFGHGVVSWIGGVWLGAVVTFFVALRDSPPAEVENHALGAEGERRTAKELRRLERQGWHVLHDVERKVNGNVDHVLIGPKGVFILDSKRWRGAIRVDDGGVITVTPVDDTSAAPRTYRDHREDLRDASNVVARALAKRADCSVTPRPVVVFWGRFPQKPTEAGRIAYVAGEDLVDWLSAQPKAKLTRSQIGQLAEAATPDLLTDEPSAIPG
jgi:hypothetical protein